MGMTIKQIVDETWEWPEEHAAELVNRTHGDITPPVDAAWDEEIQRRIADLKSRRVQGIPLEETLAKARAIVEA